MTSGSGRAGGLCICSQGLSLAGGLAGRLNPPLLLPGAVQSSSRMSCGKASALMRRQSIWTLALLGCTILALLLLASSISSLDFQAGHFYAISGARLPALEAGTALPLDPT